MIIADGDDRNDDVGRDVEYMNSCMFNGISM